MNNVERIMAKNKLLGRNYDIFNTVRKEKLFNDIINLIMEEKKSNVMLRDIPKDEVTKFVLEVDRYGKIYSITPSRIITSCLVSLNNDEEFFDNLKMLIIPNEFKKTDKIRYYQTRARYRVFGHGLLNEKDDELLKYYNEDINIRKLYNEFYKEYFDNAVSKFGNKFDLFVYFVFALIVHYFDTHNIPDLNELHYMISEAYNDFNSVLAAIQMELMNEDLLEIQNNSFENFDNSLIQVEYNVSVDEINFADEHKRAQKLLLQFAENYVDVYGEDNKTPVM